MIQILNDISGPEIVEAIEANPAAFLAFLGQTPQADLYNGPDMVRVVSGIPYPLCNTVSRARFTPDSVDDQIEETLSHFKARQMPMLWWTGPGTTPPDLGEHLSAHGLIPAGSPPGMAADLEKLGDDLPTPTGFTVEQVRDAETLKQCASVLGKVFEFPEFVVEALAAVLLSHGLDADQPAQNFAGFLDGKVVATSTLFMAGGVAGIYNVGTLPEVRGKGIGAAMTLAAMLEARSRGYRVAILHASEFGYNIYRRLGFQDYCTMNMFAWLGSPGGQGNQE
ncbi:MAG TPA: GNAT family N-acetyltransferase [Chloroflexia bacterium]|nr:GNAT family N-acetyltransferase [Chloroflexia bacterium]